MKALVILTVIAACSAFPANDNIPPNDVQPLSLPFLPPGAQLPQGAVRPQLESGVKGPQSPPGDKSQDDLKADPTFWFGYGYPSYRRSYYSHYRPRVYSYYGPSYSHWSPYHYW